MKKGGKSLKTVHEVANLAGVSKRTLQYYDEIGLLVPASITPAGYRQYSEADLERLWRILSYRELGIPLAEIRLLLDSSPDMEKELLKQHRQLLKKKQKQLQGMIGSIDRILEGSFEETMLLNFDMSEIEEAWRKYGEMVRERIAHGDRFFDFFQPFIQRKLQKGTLPPLDGEGAEHLEDYGISDWTAIRSDGEDILHAFEHAMEKGMESVEAAETVSHLQLYVNTYIFPCSDELLSEVGKVYMHEPFASAIERTKPRLASFISATIAHYREVQ